MKVHLITNCTSKKTNSLNSCVSVSEIGSTEELAAHDWANRLNQETTKLKAKDVYLGDHWSRVLELINSETVVNIISAGYGFIESNTPICRYDATFSSQNANSVSNLYNFSSTTACNQKWWKDINSFLNGYENPIEVLYNANPEDKFIIATSPTYLKVIQPELTYLAQIGRLNKENTVILSTRQSVPQELNSVFLTVKDEFTALVGGSHVSLNIRVAAFIIEHAQKGIDFLTQVNTAYNILLKEGRPTLKYKRKKLTDDDVKEFINNFLKSTKQALPTASPILRELRNQGMACEQKRFKKIFESVLQTAPQ
ncbi:hypothetical protein [Glaciecola sp. SC05]|uniref:hypothetical protein n=1 Tax=Glaciecola sp. SC05 TaxID=1987355 RepID=UPI00352808EC